MSEGVLGVLTGVRGLILTHRIALREVSELSYNGYFILVPNDHTVALEDSTTSDMYSGRKLYCTLLN